MISSFSKISMKRASCIVMGCLSEVRKFHLKSGKKFIREVEVSFDDLLKM